MIDAQLPRVERSDANAKGSEQLGGLIIEDDPELLDAYARGLWQQWQALEKKGQRLVDFHPELSRVGA